MLPGHSERQKALVVFFCSARRCCQTLIKKHCAESSSHLLAPTLCLALGGFSFFFFLFLRATAWDLSNYIFHSSVRPSKEDATEANALLSHTQIDQIRSQALSVASVHLGGRWNSSCGRKYPHSGGQFVFWTIFMRAHYFHFPSCHLVLGVFRAALAEIAPVLRRSHGLLKRDPFQ